jgi:hypothetical protein
MDEQQPRGKVDLVSVLYIVGGVPALVAFIVVLFWFARSCNISA